MEATLPLLKPYTESTLTDYSIKRLHNPDDASTVTSPRTSGYEDDAINDGSTFERASDAAGGASDAESGDIDVSATDGSWISYLCIIKIF